MDQLQEQEQPLVQQRLEEQYSEQQTSDLEQQPQRLKTQSSVDVQRKYIIRFEGNSSKKWDGKEIVMDRKTSMLVQW